MKLYFLDANVVEHLVKDDFGRPLTPDDVFDVVNADLAERKPGFISYYKRHWFDNTGRMWIDFGSHTEFYILKTRDEESKEAEENAESGERETIVGE